MVKVIYDEVKGGYAADGFTRISINLFNHTAKNHHYTYSIEDMVYYRDDVDDDWYSDIPNNKYYPDGTPKLIYICDENM